MIINQQPPSSGGGSSAATHSVTPQTYDGNTAYVYDKDTGDWVTTPIYAAVGECVLVKIVYAASFQDQKVRIGLYDSGYNDDVVGRVIPMGVNGHVSAIQFYSEECYGAFVMYDDDIVIRIADNSGSVGN